MIRLDDAPAKVRWHKGKDADQVSVNCDCQDRRGDSDVWEPSRCSSSVVDQIGDGQAPFWRRRRFSGAPGALIAFKTSVPQLISAGHKIDPVGDVVYGIVVGRNGLGRRLMRVQTPGK